MSVGEIAGLIAAVRLRGARRRSSPCPLLKLGRSVDDGATAPCRASDRQPSRCSREVTTTVTTTNEQLGQVDAITTNVAAGVDERLGADVAVRRHPRLARWSRSRPSATACAQAMSGRPAVVRHPTPSAQEAVGVRRVFWVALGATAGVLVVRRLTKAARVVHARGRRARAVRRACDCARGAVVREAGQRDAELRLPGPRRDGRARAQARMTAMSTRGRRGRRRRPATWRPVRPRTAGELAGTRAPTRDLHTSGRRDADPLRTSHRPRARQETPWRRPRSAAAGSSTSPGRGPHRGAERAAAVRRPHPAVRQRRHGAVQALLPRPGDARRTAGDQRAEVRAHPRHRGGRQDHAGTARSSR